MAQSSDAAEFRALRQRVHQGLIDAIETDGAIALDGTAQVRERIGWILQALQRDLDLQLSHEDRRRLEDELLEDLAGYGPLSPLMLAEDVSDILINGPNEVWVDRYGRLERTTIRFDDDDHLWRIVDRLVSANGRHLDRSSPMVDGRLQDGSRLHVVIPPLCARGIVVSIRRFRLQPLEPRALLASGFMHEAMYEFLCLLVQARINIVISGGAATGKTTLLNTISRFIPHSERVVTIEETAELRLEHPHVIPLEARIANVEGHGEVSLRELVRNALRMRADRIVVGEARGSEVFDMLQAMNVGHDGSLSTIHANSPEDVLPRLESLVMMGGMGLSAEFVQAMIRSSVQVIVHLTRYRDGTRRVASIREIDRSAPRLQTRELFRFQYAGVDEHGYTLGKHVATSADAAVLARLQARGFDVQPILHGMRHMQLNQLEQR